MNVVMDWIAGNPSLALILALVIALGLGAGTRELRFDPSPRVC